MTAPIDLDALEALEKAATPAPWKSRREDDVLVIVGPRAKCNRSGRPEWELAQIDNAMFWDHPHHKSEDRANARLMVAARNAFPAIVAEVRRLTELGILTAIDRRKQGEENAALEERVRVLEEALRGMLDECDGCDHMCGDWRARIDTALRGTP